MAALLHLFVFGAFSFQLNRGIDYYENDIRIIYVLTVSIITFIILGAKIISKGGNCMLALCPYYEMKNILCIISVVYLVSDIIVVSLSVENYCQHYNSLFRTRLYLRIRFYNFLYVACLLL